MVSNMSIEEEISPPFVSQCNLNGYPPLHTAQYTYSTVPVVIQKKKTDCQLILAKHLAYIQGHIRSWANFVTFTLNITRIMWNK